MSKQQVLTRQPTQRDLVDIALVAFAVQTLCHLRPDVFKDSVRGYMDAADNVRSLVMEQEVPNG